MPTITAYLRISTAAQDEQSQRQQIKDWCNANNRKVDTFEADTASGSLPWQMRRLAAIIDAAQPGQTLIVSELSRIARSTIGVLTFLEKARERGLTVIACRNNFVVDDTLPAKITITVLALAAEIERDLLRQRTKAALDARREKGLPMGRRPGTRLASKLDQHAETIKRCLAAKVSHRAIARMIECSPTTLSTWIERREHEAAEAQP